MDGGQQLGRCLSFLDNGATEEDDDEEEEDHDDDVTSISL